MNLVAFAVTLVVLLALWFVAPDVRYPMVAMFFRAVLFGAFIVAGFLAMLGD